MLGREDTQTHSYMGEDSTILDEVKPLFTLASCPSDRGKCKKEDHRKWQIFGIWKNGGSFPVFFSKYATWDLFCLHYERTEHGFSSNPDRPVVLRILRDSRYSK